MPAVISARLVVPTSRSLLEVSVRPVTVVNSLNWIRSSSNHRRPSSTDGDMEYAEFMHLPRKRFTDFGPCNSEGPKRSLLDHFFTELGAREMKQLSKFLDEDPAVMERRTNLAKRLELYQSAQSEIDAVAWSK